MLYIKFFLRLTSYDEGRMIHEADDIGDKPWNTWNELS